MIKIFIVTDEPEKWIEKLRKVMIFNKRSKCGNEYYLSNNIYKCFLVLKLLPLNQPQLINIFIYLCKNYNIEQFK